MFDSAKTGDPPHGKTNQARALANAIRTRTFDPGETIPSIRSLAAELGAGRGTVSRAVALLAREGWIQKKPYGKRYVRSMPDSDRHHYHEPSPRSISDRIFVDLRNSISAGEYDADEVIPTIKELRHRYGCGYYSVAKSLERLERQHVLVRKGKGYIVSSSSLIRDRGPTAVYFFGPPSSFRPTLAATADFIAPLEYEIQKLGWGSLRYYIDEIPSAYRAPSPSQIAGIIIVLRKQREDWERVLAGYRDIPVVAFDPWESLAWSPAKFSRHGSFHALTPDNQAAGHAMAKMALETGHKRLAFFSPIPAPVTPAQRKAAGWLLLRMQGIERILGEPGPSHAWDCYFPSANEKQKLSLESKTWWKVRADLFFRQWTPAEIHQKAVHTIEKLNYLGKTAQRLEKSFAHALSDQKATFWLCATDEAAAAALHFLRCKRIRVPQDIQVAGFDNAELAFSMRLTSFDFGIDRAAVLAARCLANPDLAPRDSAGYVRLTGRIVVRETAGRKQSTER